MTHGRVDSTPHPEQLGLAQSILSIFPVRNPVEAALHHSLPQSAFIRFSIKQQWAVVG